MAAEGGGARLLELQDSDSRWASGIYTPKWTSTTHTMLLLRGLGLPPRHPPALRACQVLLDTGFCEDGGINFFRTWRQRRETCVSGMVLGVLCWFRYDDPRVDLLADHLVAQQMADGGWNCRAMPGYGHAPHGSLHTTISALEALLEYQRFRPDPRPSGLSEMRRPLMRSPALRGPRSTALPTLPSPAVWSGPRRRSRLPALPGAWPSARRRRRIA